MGEPTKDAVTFALQGLGDNADDVAARLAEMGIVGSPGAFSCPIARFLRRTFDLPHGTVTVRHRGRIRVMPIPTEVGVPLGVYYFIASFDSGRYPELREHPHE